MNTVHTILNIFYRKKDDFSLWFTKPFYPNGIKCSFIEKKKKSRRKFLEKEKTILTNKKKKWSKMLHTLFGC